MKIKEQATEFEVQAKAYHVLANYYHVRGEIKVRPTAAGRGCRFDIVVFDKSTKRLLCTVEVKRRAGMRNTKQVYYEQIMGVPCVLIAGMEEAERAHEIVHAVVECK